MRFQVPQYIEVEDKIFGPLTFKQFIYVAGSLGICAVLFTLFSKIIAIPLSVPIAMLGLALAFYRVNDRPFALMMEDFVKYHIGSKLYIWKKIEKKSETNFEQRTMNDKPIEQLYVPKLSGNKLKEMTFALDVKQQSNPVTEDKL